MPTQAFRCDLAFCKHEPADCRTGTALDKGTGMCQAHTTSANPLAKLYRHSQAVLPFNIAKSNAYSSATQL